MPVDAPDHVEHVLSAFARRCTHTTTCMQQSPRALAALSDATAGRVFQAVHREGMCGVPHAASPTAAACSVWYAAAPAITSSSTVQFEQTLLACSPHPLPQSSLASLCAPSSASPSGLRTDCSSVPMRTALQLGDQGMTTDGMSKDVRLGSRPQELYSLAMRRARPWPPWPRPLT